MFGIKPSEVLQIIRWFGMSNTKALQVASTARWYCTFGAQPSQV